MASGVLELSPAKVFARPAAEAIWLGPVQRAALARLLEGDGIRVLVGPPSSGKTTLLAHACARWAERDQVLQARGPQTQAAGLLSALLTSAGLAPWELSAVEQRNLLTVLIQQRNGQGRRVVLAVDDAQLVVGDAWSELERLAAWRGGAAAPALDMVLVGSPALIERQNANPAVWGSAAVHGLAAPSADDVAAYLEWRLARFDLQGTITPVAAQLIARASGARFRVVDALSQMALLLMRRERLERVDARLVRQAIATFAARRSGAPDAEERPAPERVVPPDPPPGHLLVTRDGHLLRRVPLAARLLIGRSPHNDLCLPSPYLSRHHAVIVGTPEGYYVVDLGSANGVLLNGRRIARAVLCDHDILALGPFRLKVHVPEWISQGNPLPDDALVDTTIMPPRKPEAPAGIRRVK
ncbi:MAG TPA: FHA domain-containing protein [Gammaproteobacteria bacterium]